MARAVVKRLIVAAAGFGLLPFCAFGASAPPVIESQPLSSQSGTAVGDGRSIEDRLSRIERQMDNQVLLELLSKLDELQREVQELRGMAEVQGHKVEGMEQRQRELYLDIDRRLRQMESGGGAAGARPGASPPATGAPVPPVPLPGSSGLPGAGDRPQGESVAAATGSQGADPQAERTAYNRAFDLIKAGRYDESIAAFRGFLSRYPDSEYSANAQYWLGEANYVSRRYEDAAQEFQKVLQLYPDSGKASDAMLKLGFSQYELQQWGQASETLGRVVEQYPRSTARQLAEGRLQRMRMEGR